MIDKKYEKVSAEDLFSSAWEEILEKKDKEKTSKVTLQHTVTSARIASFEAAKLVKMLKYIMGWKAGEAPWLPPHTEAIALDDEYDIVEAAYKRTKSYCGEGGVAFLRTCPLTPRHGVFESVEVTDDTIRTEWKRLREIMLEKDPKGAFMLQPFISASSSGVIAPKQFAAIATGHDGITAGKGRKLYFILNPDDNIMSDHMYSLGNELGKYELEFVYQRNEAFKVEKSCGPQAYITQIRDAPPHPPRSPPFTYHLNGDKLVADVDVAIPDGRIEAKKVWVASGLEEVEWLEREITKETCEEGFVISHPNGSLMSHICAHARQHSIPYIVAEVNVGETWVEGSPTWGAIDPDGSIDPQPYDPCVQEYIVQFNKGLLKSQTHWQRQQGWFAHFFHQWAGLNYNGKESALLAGAYCGWMVKAILALSLGEMRYANRCKKNAIVDLWPTLTVMMGSDKWEELSKNKRASSNNRKHYYAMMERTNVDYYEVKKALQWCVKQFNTGWSGGYGGTAWAECAKRGVVLCETIIDFTKEPCAETLEELMGAVNLAKDAEHNNGFLYGKFLSESAFDYSSAHSVKNVDGNPIIKGLFPHSPDGISAMFRTYELASEFLDGDANENCTMPEMDWMTLFQFLQGKGANYYRHAFIAHDEDIPKLLREAAIACGPAYLHHGNKYANKDNFIPCGIEDCKLCKENDVIVMKLMYGKDIGGILLTPSYPEAFMAQGDDKSSLNTYAVVQLLRDKEYNTVTPEMWVKAWDGLNNQDMLFPILSDHLTKFAKNQMADNKLWTNDVLDMLKEEGSA